MSISKSGIKASDCEFHFAGYYVRGATQVPQSFTETGTIFHQYRCDYVDHLVDKQIDKDTAWVEAWAKANSLSEDARDLILEDAIGFSIKPDQVYGTEVFLCVDRDWKPLHNVKRPAPGKQPDHKHSFVHGTVDRIDFVREDLVLVSDYKSGYLFKSDEREAALYALLVFCHFPGVQKVTFSWDFIRAGASTKSEFLREELPYLQGLAVAAHKKQMIIADKAALGDSALTTNPFVGLCTYCDLLCPLRAAASRGEFPAAPPQNDADAVAIVGMLRANKKTQAALEDMLRPYLGERGPLQTPGEKPAEIKGGATMEVPLLGLLNLVGLETNPDSMSFDLDLGGLKVGVTELKKLFKKNPDFEQACNETFERKPRSSLSV